MKNRGILHSLIIVAEAVKTEEGKNLWLNLQMVKKD